MENTFKLTGVIEGSVWSPLRYLPTLRLLFCHYRFWKSVSHWQIYTAKMPVNLLSQDNTWWVCVCECVCAHWVEKRAGKDRHLKGQSLGSYTSYTQWRSRECVCVCVCVCVCAEGSRKGQASEGPELGLTHFTHRVEIQSGTWGWQQTPGLSRPMPQPPTSCSQSSLFLC